jgi:hypothetical protein
LGTSKRLGFQPRLHAGLAEIATAGNKPTVSSRIIVRLTSLPLQTFDEWATIA